MQDLFIDRVTGATLCRTCNKMVVQFGKILWCDCTPSDLGGKP